MNGQLANKLEGILATLGDNEVTGEYKGYRYKIDNKLTVTIEDKVQGISFSYQLNPEGYTNGNIILTIETSSTNGKITSIEAPESLIKNEDETYMVIENGNYNFIIKDSTGASETKTINIQKIDRIEPTIIGVSINEVTQNGFTIIVNAVDEESGILRYEYYINGTKYDSNVITGLLPQTEYAVIVKVYDKAENMKESDEVIQYTQIARNEIAEAIEKGTALSETENTPLTDIYGNKIIIPAGFKVTSDATTVDKGIVIEDIENGNEFVWIPVPENGKLYTDISRTETNAKMITLGRYVFDSSGNIDTELSKTEPSDQLKTISTSTNYYIEGLTTETTANVHAKDINTFRKSVEVNKGYYIGRYEARTGTSRSSSSSPITEMTEKGTDYVYNYITQAKAAERCQIMYGSDKPFISDLINSYAWDTATLFLQECGSNSKYSIKTSVNSSLATKGTNRNTKKDVECNIYDMASNLFEWTTETYSSSSSCVRRGDYYYNTVAGYTSMRDYQPKTLNSVYNGFRPILYLQSE